MEDIKSQLAKRLNDANNVLVTVASSPSVDQLSAAIGLTLILNKLGKHATAVFSGAIPPAIEFLQPEKTIEKNTDSLRDFIIALDKAKADKLRYKIEDQFVKIFITPYHSSIGEKDLVFSQGDFNVDVIIALGVHKREELDQAIVAHGKILHDATVATINTDPPSNVGSLNWADKASSSLCEMLVRLTDLLAEQGSLFDAQIANALLTGIVAETQRFSNSKTTSLTMGASSQLLAAGANQQLIASKLQPPAPKPAPVPIAQQSVQESDDQVHHLRESAPKAEEVGTLKIDHGNRVKLNSDGSSVQFDNVGEQEPDLAEVQIDDQGNFKSIGKEEEDKAATENEDSSSSTDSSDTQETKPETEDKSTDKSDAPVEDSPRAFMADPASANAGNTNESDETAVDPLSEEGDKPPADAPSEPKILSHSSSITPEAETVAPATSEEATSTDAEPQPAEAPTNMDINALRDQVNAALSDDKGPTSTPPEVASDSPDATKDQPAESDSGDNPPPPPFAPPFLPKT